MSIQWGWKITCEHPGCNKVLERWSKNGTPPFYGNGLLQSGSANGWYIYNTKTQVSFKPADYSLRYIVYCPEHVGPVLEWLKLFKAWRIARSSNKKPILTLRERLEAFLDPENGTRRFKKRISQLDNEWLKQNPVPLPPWKAK